MENFIEKFNPGQKFLNISALLPPKKDKTNKQNDVPLHILKLVLKLFMTRLNHCCAPGLGPQLPLRGPPPGSFLISAGIFFYLVPYTCLLCSQSQMWLGGNLKLRDLYGSSVDSDALSSDWE